VNVTPCGIIVATLSTINSNNRPPKIPDSEEITKSSSPPSEEQKKEQEKKLLLKELLFTQQALTRNPKSYWCWNQREWATRRLHAMNACPWKEELALCSKLLHHDARNFHCWNYRRYVAAQSQITEADEFQFTTTLIEENFSNYSAWHQRSKLLPLLYPEEEAYEEAIEGELEIVKNAFYTMPNDSSAWFYHRWLVNQNPSRNILTREVDAIEELLTILESDEEKKWPKLTLVFLLKHLDSADSRIASTLSELVQVDPQRQRYYEHLAATVQG